MKKFCLVATLLLLSAGALAQIERPARPGAAAQAEKEEKVKPPAPQASITININGLSCQTSAGTATFPVQSWSWGASNPIVIGSATGGAGSGKASFSDLSIQKKFDQCSPALFGAVVKGDHFNTLTLTQEDANGNVVLTATLSTVFVSSWQAGGSVQDPLPMESVSFAFAKICIADTGSGAKFCWDITQNKSF